jgi:flagellin-like protein
MKMRNREDAVSPVIGTILLVAITVILVAIIAAVVMGMTGNVAQPKNVGLTVEGTMNNPNPNAWETLPYYVVHIYGGRDVTNLKYINISVEGSEQTMFWGDTHGRGNNEAPALTWEEYLGETDFESLPPEEKTQLENDYKDNYLSQEFGIPVSELVGTGLYYISYPFNLDGSTKLVTVTGTFLDGSQSVLYKGMVGMPKISAAAGSGAAVFMEDYENGKYTNVLPSPLLSH